jgi:hypothetical protein
MNCAGRKLTCVNVWFVYAGRILNGVKPAEVSAVKTSLHCVALGW